MPTLSNPKHERFAQEIAKGKSATKAMKAAGYSDPRNSTRMMKNDDIRHRIDELQGKAAEKHAITVDSLIEEFDGLTRLATARGQVAAAVSALTAKAKLSGLWIDRTEAKNENVNYVISDEPLTAEEWAAECVSTH